MRIGVIGLGFMGATHLRAYRSVGHAEVVAVASRGKPGLARTQGNLDLAEEPLDLGDYRHYFRWEELVADPAIEAVDICLPTAHHEAAAIAALQAGKHVLVEKPMALDYDGARRMIDAARAARKILMTAQVLRFFPAYQALVDAATEIGTPRAAWFRRRCAAPDWADWMRDALQSGGGAFDLLVHDVDFALHLYGAPASLIATGHQDLASSVDVMTAQWLYPSDFSVTIAGGWHHPRGFPFSMEYTVVGDGGSVDYSSAGRLPVLFDSAGRTRPLPLGAHDGFVSELQYFVDCARTGQPPEKCPPEESARAVAMMRLMLEARRRNGEVIPCTLA